MTKEVKAGAQGAETGEVCDHLLHFLCIKRFVLTHRWLNMGEMSDFFFFCLVCTSII